MTTPTAASIRYSHTQAGTLMLVILPIGALALAVAAFTLPVMAARGALWAAAILLVILAWLFSSLTVEVTEDEIRWRFGPGLIRFRLPRSDIESSRVVRNSWLNGFGIRMRPGFRLYNVSGLDAVELRLKSGDIRRLGSDDAEQLAAALKS
jgi:hypothetical protein